MTDAQIARLCVQLIHSHFGPLTAKVVSVLLSRGRLSLFHLTRFTSLKSRTVRAAILVLVQHNILWHARTEDEGEVLEVNVNECLMRLRFGRFVWQAEQLFGKAGAEIVQLILDHGKLRPPDILSRLLSSDPKGSSIYSQTLFKLVAASYLKPSTTLSHISPRDKCIQYEGEEKAKIVGFPTTKELRQAKEAAAARLKREEEAEGSVGLKPNPVHRSVKRKTIDNDLVVDDDVFFRVNFEKFNIHIRNMLIEATARERFNDGAALVIRAVLKATESTQASLTEVRSDPIPVTAVAMQLSEEDDLSSGLAMPSKNASNVACIKEYLAMLASADNPTPAGRAASFLSFGSPKVQVQFDIVARRLRRRVLESVTRERHGKEGVRILRLLLDTGKMDEKQISKVAMMAPKDVRPLLAALSADSLISVQEVPKSADRNPTRMFYLWHVDLYNAYTAILGNLYKTLYNIGMRRQAEQEEPGVKAVLEKRERSDVSEDESLLTRMEREVLKELESKQERLTILEMRVEEAVFILRDLCPPGYNDD